MPNIEQLQAEYDDASAALAAAYLRLKATQQQIKAAAATLRKTRAALIKAYTQQVRERPIKS